MDQDFYDYAVAAAVPDDDFYYVSWDNPIYDDFQEYDYSGMYSQLKKTNVFDISIFILLLYRSCRSESKTYGYKYHCRLQHEATSEVNSNIMAGKNKWHYSCYIVILFVSTAMCILPKGSIF